MDNVTQDDFMCIGMSIMGRNHHHANETSRRRFSAWFGTDPQTCAILWEKLNYYGWLDYAGIRGTHPKHLLWSLMFLKCYATEAVHSANVGVDEKTYRKWIWFYLEGITLLRKHIVGTDIHSGYSFYDFATHTIFIYILYIHIKILWRNRCRQDTYQRCMVTIDGIDCQIEEPIPFSRKWYSHKFSGPGVRYELGVSINTGDIVSLHGPFPCGAYPDISIFRLGLKRMLGPGEKVIADRGYRGDTKTCTPLDSRNQQHSIAMGRARARHETINGRLKKWNCIKNVYRHHLDKHYLIFTSIAIIEQISISNGRAPFQITTYIDPALAT